MLSDRDILSAMESGELRIEPSPDRRDVQPASVDLHLGSTLRTEKGGLLRFPQPGSYYTLAPGEFILGTTEEWVRIGDGLASRFEGKSSLGRIGLLTHVSAGFIDPGFKGQITVEIVNLSRSNIELTYLMPIGQICFFRLDTPAERPYGHPKRSSHYQNQHGPTPSVLRKDTL